MKYRQAITPMLMIGVCSITIINCASSSATSAGLPNPASLQRSCDGGNPRACNNLGVAYATGAGVSRDAANAASLYKRACDGGDSMGCTNLGAAYADGEGIAKDEATAAALYERACEAETPYACMNLAFVCSTGAGVAQDEARAEALYQKACQGELKSECPSYACVTFKNVSLDTGRRTVTTTFHNCRGGGTAVNGSVTRTVSGPARPH
jgi:hypothetical protein